MEKTKLTGKTLFWPYGTVPALLGHFLEKWRSGKQVSLQKVPACESCQTNPARVRVDQLHNGRVESHFLCQSCTNEYTVESREF